MLRCMRSLCRMRNGYRTPRQLVAGVVTGTVVCLAGDR